MPTPKSSRQINTLGPLDIDHVNQKAAYKRTLGTYPTGVTVITAATPDGRIGGLTVNSFSSLSLSPPLIMWAIGSHPSSRPIFDVAEFFAVNFLAVDQAEVSRRFARNSGDRFGPMDWEPGLGGAPLLKGCAAYLECQVVSRAVHGDHLLIIGESVRYLATDLAPLVYFRGAYHEVGGVVPE